MLNHEVNIYTKIQKRLKSKHALVSTPSLSVIILITTFIYSSQSVYALSPSLPLHETRDEPLDWLDIYKNYTRVITGLPYSDIFAVSYFSDGNTLNATLWLTESFKFNTSADIGKINYGMFIDADSDETTGLNGVDYQIEISGENGNWTKFFWQYWSLSGYNRTLDKEEQYDKFYGQEKDDKFVVISADLRKMGFPDKYRVLFYGEQLKEGSVWKTDYTKWIHVPVPDFEIIPSPSTVELKQGDRKDIEMQIKSTTDFEPVVNLVENRENPRQISLDFNSTGLEIPPNGMRVTPLHIKVPEDAPIGQHTLQISANGSFPAEQIVEPNIQVNNTNFPSFVKSENVTKASTLTITVEPKVPFHEEALDQLNKWEFAISFFSGIVTGHLGPWIFNKMRHKGKNKNNQKLDSRVPEN